MAEETKPPQAGDPPTPPGTPQAGNPPATPPAGNEPPAPDNSTEALQGKLAKSVAAEKNLRDRLKAAEAAEAELKTLKEKDLSEVERLKKEVAEKDQAATEAVARARRMQVRLKAQELGLIPDAAERMLDVGKLDDSDDAITTALNDALKTYPWLKAEKPGVTTSPGNPAKSTTTLTKEQIAKMTPAEINERWADVQKVMAAG